MKSIALIGTYLPRKCGIATFTADLSAAILDNDPEIDCSIVAMNDRPDGHEYPESVRFQIDQDQLNQYDLAASFLNLKNPDTYRENIKTAAKALLSGQIVAFPTETVYGLGVCADNKDAIDNLYRVKQRSRDKKLSIMIARTEDITKYVKYIPSIAEKLISSFWPGPLTIIFKASQMVPNLITGDTGKVGIRIPGCPFTRKMIREVGFPMVGTSANLSGKPGAMEIKPIQQDFGDRVDLYLDVGRLDPGEPSTVVDLTGEKLVVVREGMIGMDQLKNVK